MEVCGAGATDACSSVANLLGSTARRRRVQSSGCAWRVARGAWGSNKS